MTCRLQLYQFAERLNKLQTVLKSLKRTKHETIPQITKEKS